MGGSNNNDNQNDAAARQAEANARSARRQGGSVLDKGAQQLEDYTAKLERTAGQATASMGQTGMFTFGGPGGRSPGSLRDSSDFDISEAETDPWKVAAGITEEEGEEWESLGEDLSEAEDELSDIESAIAALRLQQQQSGSSGPSSSRDVSVTSSDDSGVSDYNAGGHGSSVQGDGGSNDSGAGANTTTVTSGGGSSGGGSSGSSGGGLSEAQRERLQELQEQADPIEERISELESQRGEISSQYEGEGSFEDAMDRASDISSGWSDALSEAGDTELDTPEQLRMAQGSNLLNISRMRANMDRDVSKIKNAALTGADSAFFDAQQQQDNANYFEELADEQRRAERTQSMISGIAGGASLLGGAILTFGVPGGQAAGIGMMAGGAGQLGSSFI